MLHRIELRKFKCFNNHNVTFKDICIIVGKNNAGKSTMIEALRLISIVLRKSKNGNYISPPDWAKLHLIDKGIRPSLKGIDFNSENIIHDYEDPPAKITAFFRTKSKIIIYLNDNNRIFAQLFDEKGKLIKTRKAARQLNINEIKILPQIGPLSKSEKLLQEDYVKANEFTSITSIHFRNQIQYRFELFQKFKELFEQTWKEIKINNFIKGDRLKEIPPSLFLRERSFVVEAGKMGHGLQMWLQIIWFLIRCNENDTIILDEPDVYLHADIQRKIIRILKGKYSQVILATHSIEIISEVEPENILIINRNQRKSKYATNSPIVQEIVSQLGSIQNLELIRLWSSKRFIILEGDSDDLKFLKIFQDCIFNQIEIPFDNLPNSHISGWGGWQRVIGSYQVISKNQEINCYCILDSDYHTEEEINNRYLEALKYGINLHIWSSKEIENYLIIDSVIKRFIKKKSGFDVPLSVIQDKLEELCEEFKNKIFDSYATEIQNRTKGLAASTANKNAREIMKKSWTTLENRIKRVPGKIFISALSRWTKEKYNVSINKFALAAEIRENEIDSEVKLIVNSIELLEPFYNPMSNTSVIV